MLSFVHSNVRGIKHPNDESRKRARKKSVCAYNKKARLQRIALGLCGTCGKEPLALGSKSVGPACQISMRERRDRIMAQPEKKANIFAKAREYRMAVRQKVFDHYGTACACCGESEDRFLELDHINSDGAKQRRETRCGVGIQFYFWLARNGFPAGVQTLCSNCNKGRHRNGGICPHKDLK